MPSRTKVELPRTLRGARALTVLAALGLLLTTASPALASLRVVATTPDMAAVAKAVGGDDATVDVLASPKEDPHFVDARPNLLVPLSRADLLVLNGAELEIGWLPPLLVQARNADIQIGARGYFDASVPVPRMGVPRTRIDRRQGDIHPSGNPHYAHDPRAVAKVAVALGEAMARLAPTEDEAARYRQRAAQTAQRLEALATKWAKRFQALPPASRKVVIYHESMLYVQDWLGLDRVIAVEPVPGIQPSPGHVAKVLKAMKSAKVKAILQEVYYPRSTTDTLAKLTGATVVTIPGGADFRDGETYEARVERMTQGIYDALSR